MAKQKNNTSEVTNGYSLSRYNSLNHGVLSRLKVLPWEDAKELEEIQSSFLEEHQPKGATEKYLVLELANITFRRSRLYQAESALVCKNLYDMGNSSTPYHAKAAKFLSKEDCKQESYENNDTLEKAFYHDASTDQEDIDYYVQKSKHAQDLIDSTLSYEEMLKRLDPYLVEVWKTYEDQYEANKDGLVLYLEERIIKYSQDKIASIKARPYVQQHAIASAYIPDEKTETLQRYETGLDRRFERVLSMLLKLQNHRKESSLVNINPVSLK